MCKKYENNFDLSIECRKGKLEHANKINEEFRRDENECYKRY